MNNVVLHEFIALHREEIIRRCRAKVATRSMPPPTEAEIDCGVPLFLDQLVDALRLGLSSSPQIERTASRHGHELLLKGFTVSQVVQDYGDVCQSVTGLSVERNAPISTDDFRTLNRCLDDAIAGAVTEFGLGRDQSTLDGESARGNERLGFLAHEVQTLIHTAIIAFEVIKSGNVGNTGSTAAVLDGCLMGIRNLLGRSLAEVRLPQRVQSRAQFLVAGFIEELAGAATLEANAQGVALKVLPVEDGVVIDADRQVLAGVVRDLLQNAFKFTRRSTTVTLRVGASAERVLIEILDECDGLPNEKAHDLFRSFQELPVDGTDAGLGLAFSRWGVEANDGRISARNLPEKGCVFTIDLPRVAMPVLAARPGAARDAPIPSEVRTMSGAQTALGTVAIFDASDDTVAMIQMLLTEAGASQSLIRCPFADLKRGITDFRKYLDQHNPEVVIFDLSPPYDENWGFFTIIRDAAAMQGRGVVLTTTSKKRLDELIGEDSRAFEVVGTVENRALILDEILVATRRARTARRQAMDGALIP
jgi:signal transduction histidine kinase